MSHFVCMSVCSFVRLYIYCSFCGISCFLQSLAVLRSMENSLANLCEELNSEKKSADFKNKYFRKSSSQVQHAHPLGASWVLLRRSPPQN